MGLVSRLSRLISVTMERKSNFIQHIVSITKNATWNRRILYSILHRYSPISMKTRLNLLRLHTSLIITYAGAFWTPSIFSYFWGKIEAVQIIGIRTITGIPSFVRKSLLLKSANFRIIQNLIKPQSKTMFYKEIFSLPTYATFGFN